MDNPNVNMKLGPDGEALIKSFESYQSKAYIDTYDKDGNPRYSIGWGHFDTLYGKKITADMTISLEDADKLFKEDAVEYENKVKRMVTVPLNQNQFDALVCMAYNVATANFQRMVDISELNKGIYDKVPDAMLHFNVSGGRILKGLTRRRKEEGALFTKK